MDPREALLVPGDKDGAGEMFSEESLGSMEIERPQTSPPWLYQVEGLSP